LESLLIKFGLRATITRSENEQLLRTTMPEGFFDPNHELYTNPLARYIVAGLHSTLVARIADSWFQSMG